MINRTSAARLAWSPRFFNPKLSKWLHRVTVPTQILWGAEDPFLPVAIGRRLNADIPGSTLAVVPDARHFTPEEAPEKVAEVLTELLAR